MALTSFAPALPDLQASVPEWWQTDPGSEFYRWLYAIGQKVDELSAAFEKVYGDNQLATASQEALLAEWALAYAMQQELPPSLSAAQMRAYIQLVIGANGGSQSLQNLLLAIILANPANLGGTVLTFDAGGLGLTFPTSGSGLVMYQYATVPDQTVGFLFPPDGSPLVFGPPGGVTFPGDGSGLAFPSAGGGIAFPSVVQLAFPNSAWVTITETFALYTFTVTVKSYLAFDRNAFKRAVERLRQAHTTWAYLESNT